MDLYNKLKEAYTLENLNSITRKLLLLFKRKQYDHLRRIMRIIDKRIEVEKVSHHKLFARLMMQYHPDKQNFYHLEIDKHRRNGDLEKLQEYSHILILLGSEILEVEENKFFETEVDDQNLWKENEHNFSYFYEDYDMEDDMNNRSIVKENDSTFYALLKRNLYGDLNIELPSFMLEDLKELELESCQMESLDGIEHCKHLLRLNLSNNNLTDITDLQDLHLLEEINLAGNYISLIDSLAFLTELKNIDLSFNEIDDITPLFELPKLELVVLTGNKRVKDQIQFLTSQGITVEFD